MSEDIKTVVLYGTDGCTLVGKVKIRCVGRLPPLIEWDDSPEGSALFVHEVGVSYRQQFCYLLSLGRIGEVECEPPTAPDSEAEPRGADK